MYTFTVINLRCDVSTTMWWMLWVILENHQTCESSWGVPARVMVFYFFFFKNNFIYRVLAVLGLHCCRGFLSSCGAQASHCHGFLWNMGSRCLRFSSMARGSIIESVGLTPRRHVGSSWTRDWTHVFCTGRRILNHWATREAPVLLLNVLLGCAC